MFGSPISIWRILMVVTKLLKRSSNELASAMMRRKCTIA